MAIALPDSLCPCPILNKCDYWLGSALRNSGTILTPYIFHLRYVSIGACSRAVVCYSRCSLIKTWIRPRCESVDFTSSMAESNPLSSSIPAHFYDPPALSDTLETNTSRQQEDTLEECLPLLKAFDDPKRSPFDFNEFGLPALEREDHIGFLLENLGEFPAPFVGLDASRPWMVYWALFALYLLGEETAIYRSRYYIVHILHSSR